MSFVTHRFKLEQAIVENLYSRTCKFGYNGFSEFIFYRTYSRQCCAKCRSANLLYDRGSDYCGDCGYDGPLGQETWHDCVRRVIEGILSIRKDWYIKNNINWDESLWQHYAMHMAIAMFKMEWLPPGRGMWACGTNFVYNRGSMSLNNCGFIEVTDDIGLAVDFQMDALMNGVGVGFAPLKNDSLKVYNPTNGMQEFVIPDSREGWCLASKMLVNSYLQPGQAKLRLIYDEIREAGLPIRGFGGISSGSGSLKYFHEQVHKFFDYYTSRNWYNSVMLKADISNAIGCCVISGNVRRSAQLLCGPIDDIIDLKDYEMYPHRESHGWMSNNSVALKEDSDFERLGEIAARIIKNGEPGFINLKNMPFGRIGKSMDGLRLDEAIGFNPCVTGDSKVFTADGRGYVAIKELAEIGNDVDVYCINNENQLAIRTMRNPRKTGEKQKIVRIAFNDGMYVRCTERHKWLLRDGTYKEAINLSSGDALPTVNRYIPTSKSAQYYKINYGKLFEDEHTFVGRHKVGVLLQNEQVHHINRDTKDNTPANLEVLDRYDHMSTKHLPENGIGYSGYTNADLLEHGIQLALKLGRRFSTKEWRAQGLCWSEFREKTFGKLPQFAYLCAKHANVMNLDCSTKTMNLMQRLVAEGWTCEVVGNKVFVAKFCKNCKGSFSIVYSERNQSCCSKECDGMLKGTAGLQIAHSQYIDTMHEHIRGWQLDVYTKLMHEFQRIPTWSEWRHECQVDGLSWRVGKGRPFPSWAAIVEAAKNHNHRVCVVYSDGEEDVYNGTVDDFHNYVVKIGDDAGKLYEIERGIISRNCGEINLSSFELCCLSSSLPTKCETEQDWSKSLEYATMYASTVTLLPTHRVETNSVMLKNRRIGVGLISVAEWQQNIGTTRLIKNLRTGYEKVRLTNKWLANEAGIPEAIRFTSIQPGGTSPRLASTNSGWSWPTFGLTLRRVRIGQNSPICKLLNDANIPHEPDLFSANTEIYEFPIDQGLDGKLAPATEIGIWQQAMTLVLLQREWTNNSCSNTIYFSPKWALVKDVTINEPFYNGGIDDEVRNLIPMEWDEFLKDQEFQGEMDYNGEKGLYKIKLRPDKWSDVWKLKVYRYNPDHEENAVEHVLSAIAPLTKSVSMLPHSAKGVYLQSPEEGISKEEYDKRLAAIKPIDWSKLSGSDGQDEKYCQGASCEVS